MTPTLPLRLLLSASAVALGALAATAGVASPVLPTGGSVRAGNATIGAPIGSSLTVNQTSTKAVIDWSTFSIGAGGKVNFANGHGVTLNRVIGGGQSDIFGTLTSTGSVFLLNQNGVFIGKGGVVNVGGSFVASSLDMTDNAFMNGRVLTLSGAGRGAVTNQGDIVATAGDVELIGQQVTNGGTIRAPGGEVGFAAGQQVTLSQGAPTGEKLTVTIGDPGASITNTGLVTAVSAELRANGGNIYALAINAGSRIEATGIASKGGDVYLTAGSGALTAQGEIDATHADGSGGFVETSGHTVDFAGLRVRAGQWLIDPVNLTIDQAAASTIDANLATTSVTLKTTAGAASGPGVQSAGAGDIVVSAPISWASANSLTLDAFHSIDIEAAVTASGAGKVALMTNDGGSGGDYDFGLGPAGFAGSLSFTGAPHSGQALTINGQPYTLIFTESDLVNVNNNLGGFYALAAPLALTTFPFTASPIASTVATPFTGVFTGLGNSISGLTITDTTAASPASDQFSDVVGTVGLFGAVRGPDAVIEDVRLANVAVTGGDGMDVGAVTGALIEGSLVNVSSSGAVTTGSGLVPGVGEVAFASAGGLVGEAGPNSATAPGASIEGSSSLASVVGADGWSGGLVGHTSPGTTIAGSFASGTVVTGSTVGVQIAEAGGLVGSASGATISGSYATGDASGASGSYVGGFAGLVVGAQITTSWASGAATLSGSGGDVGGFAAFIQPGAAITQSFSSGAVSAINQAAGSSTNAGGFAGYVDGTISQAYSTGSVTTGGAADQVGGFAGEIDAGGSVDQVYATGQVSTPGTAGGLAGTLGGALSDSYWDEGTTGRTTGFNLSGAGAATGVVGMGGTTGVNPFDAATYAGWDFNNTWSTPSAGFYPELFGVSHVLRITVDSSTIEYGGSPVFSNSVFGFQDGDPATVARTVSGLQGQVVGGTTSTAGFFNVGAYPLRLSNGAASDPSGTYRIIYVDGQLNVTPRPLSASLSGTVEKTYDGTLGAGATVGNLTLTGMLTSDQVSVAPGFTSAYASKNVGTGIVVTASGLTLTGADAADYSVSSTSAAVGIIDPKALTASLTGQVVKAADGTTIATLGADNYALSGVVSGDSVNLNDPTTGVYDSSAVGQGRTVTVTGIALEGADAGDYTVNTSAQGPVGVIQPAANVVQVSIVTTPTGDITQPLVDTGDQSGGAGDQSASTGGHPRVTPETVFPYATSATQQTQSSDSSPVTGEGNGDLWWGSDEDDDKKDKR